MSTHHEKTLKLPKITYFFDRLKFLYPKQTEFFYLTHEQESDFKKSTFVRNYMNASKNKCEDKRLYKVRNSINIEEREGTSENLSLVFENKNLFIEIFKNFKLDEDLISGYHGVLSSVCKTWRNSILDFVLENSDNIVTQNLLLNTIDKHYSEYPSFILYFICIHYFTNGNIVDENNILYYNSPLKFNKKLFLLFKKSPLLFSYALKKREILNKDINCSNFTARKFFPYFQRNFFNFGFLQKDMHLDIIKTKEFQESYSSIFPSIFDFTSIKLDFMSLKVYYPLYESSFYTIFENFLKGQGSQNENGNKKFILDLISDILISIIFIEKDLYIIHNGNPSIPSSKIIIIKEILQLEYIDINYLKKVTINDTPLLEVLFGSCRRIIKKDEKLDWFHDLLNEDNLVVFENLDESSVDYAKEYGLSESQFIASLNSYQRDLYTILKRRKVEEKKE